MKYKKYLIAGVIAFVLALVLSAAIIRKTYTDNLKPIGNSTQKIVFTVRPGSTTAEIADGLKDKGLIRSDWAFEWYARNHMLRGEVKHGTYLLSQSLSIPKIFQILSSGEVAQDLVTILPAQRLDQIRDALINKYGFSAKSVDLALKPTQYRNHPALTDKPKSASLEGYLYPESFHKTAETTPKQIISLSLDEMDARLTPELRQAFSSAGLTVHEAVILSSIVEQEVSSDYDRARVAQVLLKRYRSGINLAADPTAFYEAKAKGDKPTVTYDSPYNTYLYPGLPPGPIGNVSESSLEAVAYPAQTDWLYFVSGDDGKTYFSKSLEKHQELTRRYCKKLCAQ